MGETSTHALSPEVIARVAEEVPIIAELFGDETQQVTKTIDDLIDKGISQQTREQITAQNTGFEPIKKRIVTPPFDQLKLALLLEQNTRLNRSVHLRSRNTVGLGWLIGRVKFDEDEKAPSDQTVRKQKERLKRVYGNPQPRSVERLNSNSPPLDFAEISYRSKVDEEATGNGYFEVTRSNSGAIDGVFNIPAHTIRVLKEGGFVQLRGRKRKFFKSFGDLRPIRADTGEEGTDLALEARANELLQFVIYSSRSSFYGIPRWISAVAAVQGSRLSAIRNIAFFENDAVGRLAIVVSGGALSKESSSDIRDFVNREGKGVEKAHRVMVIQADPKRIIGGRGKETKIDIVPLTVGLIEDASFLGYRKANDEEIREAFGLAPPFFTGEGVNRATGGILRKITIEQDLVPDMKSHENIWNKTVSTDILTQPMSDAEKAKFQLAARLRYEPASAIDDLEIAQIQGMLARAGIVTINEARMQLGLKALPDDFVYGKLPLPVAIAYLDAGILLQPAITPEGTLSLAETQAALAATGDQGTQPVQQSRVMGVADITKLRAKFGYLEDIGNKLVRYMKSKHGRDVIGAELILEATSGQILDRIALDDIPMLVGSEEDDDG